MQSFCYLKPLIFFKETKRNLQNIYSKGMWQQAYKSQFCFNKYENWMEIDKHL